MKLSHEFVKAFPAELAEGVIYISMEYRTAVHKCCCGCSQQVITPFNEDRWKLILDGGTVSIYPSIGNWNFPCQSHYWIISSEVKWVPKRSDSKRRNRYQSVARRSSILRRIFAIWPF